MRWIILTGEYPPDVGGVADYTRLVARALARSGDDVHVWTPSAAGSLADHGVRVHSLPDRFGRRSRTTLHEFLSRLDASCRVLVQYAPTAFGWRGMNVPFCVWLRRQPCAIDVMFHEVAFPWGLGQSPLSNVRGAVNRLMARVLVGGSSRVFVSIPAWARLLGRAAADRTTWLPVPSTISAAPSVDERRSTSIPGGCSTVIGHFGSYGRPACEVLLAVIPRLLRADRRRAMLLAGRGGDAFARECAGRYPDLRDRLIAPGFLDETRLAAHLSACDLAFQPYPDGVSSRRTTAMAALALGLPLVTSAGPLTESLWRDSAAVVLVGTGASADDLLTAIEAVASSPARARSLAEKARALYQERFALDRTIATLRGPHGKVAACA